MIYADNNGSCPLHPKVVEYLSTRLVSGPYANPNSIHSLGRKMNFGLEKCRRACAKILGAKTDQVSFNSGASEGISHVFHSVLSERQDDKNIILNTEIINWKQSDLKLMEQ
jgi:cysteine desulfurase